MSDDACVRFLQWSLPRLRLRWRGFRRVRLQVCKRLRRRIAELQLADLDAYRSYLQSEPDEWHRLDGLCRITISRFYRDRAVFDALRAAVLPRLIRDREQHLLRAWCAGCASGEETYTLRLLWMQDVGLRFPQSALEIVATEVDQRLLDRARQGAFPRGTLRELPQELLPISGGLGTAPFRIPDRFREGIRWMLQDIRRQAPAEEFDLVLCRNLAFTYFEEDLQREVLGRIAVVLPPGGALVIGANERLPDDSPAFSPWAAFKGIYRRV